ncbi:MAG: M48 family peptidase, partial [Nanoarchaeota archaeon]
MNLRNLSPKLPEEGKGIYDEEKYKKSQEYYKANHDFSVLTSTFGMVIILLMLYFNGFAYVDAFVRNYTDNLILMTLMFFGTLIVAFDVIQTPFSLYKTFVIEKKFGFNKTSVKTYILDKIKEYFLMMIIGGGLLALIAWTYQLTGKYFWILAWIAVSIFI